MISMTYPEWEKLCTTHSEEHAVNAFDPNAIIRFRLGKDNNRQLQYLDNVLFAKRPDINLFIQPAFVDNQTNKFQAYSKEDFDTLSRLKHLRKLSVPIAVKQNFQDFPAIGFITKLSIYADIKTDLHLLEIFPDISYLHLQGKFTEVTSLSRLQKLNGLSVSGFKQVDFSGLTGLKLKTLSISDCEASENFDMLLSGSVEKLTLSGIKKVENIGFIANATGLRKLYLDSFSLPALPCFSKNQKLTALQINEMHKLDHIESLIDSDIEYLFVLVSADKVPAKAFAETLMKMKKLKKALMRLMDRNEKRYITLKRYLEKNGKEDLLSEDMNFFQII